MRYILFMKFEYDPDKSAANREKHGIDFDEAQALWDDPYLIEAPANVTDEQRFLAVGLIGARHWTAIYTYRSSRVRIISVRRARKQEIDYYEID
ncbi:BrnT family toxin [Loktanella sp. M215]|uniref:BrnT family toxin n=1 Tax=Loktanella sp. M215 TaxID=2675431 RepID=UPI001F245EC5|nr:BrnT family toxin [Loktanella sp. M215]